MTERKVVQFQIVSESDSMKAALWVLHDDGSIACRMLRTNECHEEPPIPQPQGEAVGETGLRQRLETWARALESQPFGFESSTSVARRLRALLTEPEVTPSPAEPAAAGDVVVQPELLDMSVGELAFMLAEAYRDHDLDRAELTRLREPIEITDEAVEAARDALYRTAGKDVSGASMRDILTAALRALGR